MLDEVKPIITASPCPQKPVSHYYQQLLGEEAAGSNVEYLEQLVLAICPQAYR